MVFFSSFTAKKIIIIIRCSVSSIVETRLSASPLGCFVLLLPYRIQRAGSRTARNRIAFQQRCSTPHSKQYSKHRLSLPPPPFPTSMSDNEGDGAQQQVVWHVRSLGAFCASPAAPSSLDCSRCPCRSSSKQVQPLRPANPSTY